LICHWDPVYSTYKLERYHFQYLIVSHDQSVILVPAQMLVMNGDGLTITLPETSLEISKDKARVLLVVMSKQNYGKAVFRRRRINRFQSPYLSHTCSTFPSFFVSLV